MRSLTLLVQVQKALPRSQLEASDNSLERAIHSFIYYLLSTCYVAVIMPGTENITEHRTALAGQMSRNKPRELTSSLWGGVKCWGLRQDGQAEDGSAAQLVLLESE